MNWLCLLLSYFFQVLKESFKIYCAINDGIINLVDKVSFFFHLQDFAGFLAYWDIYMIINFSSLDLFFSFLRCPDMKLLKPLISIKERVSRLYLRSLYECLELTFFLLFFFLFLFVYLLVLRDLSWSIANKLSVLLQATGLSDFYEVCKGLELARNFQFPVLREVRDFY